MRFGTVVHVKGRGKATIVYHGPDGYGAIWGVHKFDDLQEELAAQVFAETAFAQDPVNRFQDEVPPPEIMLRTPYPNPAYGVECVGSAYEVLDA